MSIQQSITTNLFSDCHSYVAVFLSSGFDHMFFYKVHGDIRIQKLMLFSVMCNTEMCWKQYAKPDIWLITEKLSGLSEGSPSQGNTWGEIREYNNVLSVQYQRAWRNISTQSW